MQLRVEKSEFYDLEPTTSELGMVGRCSSICRSALYPPVEHGIYIGISTSSTVLELQTSSF
jgi:hypothetical protein